MAHRYLLDTNIISRLLREPDGGVAARIGSVGERAVCTSVVVAAELRYGARKSGSAALSERVRLVLSAMDILPLKPPADRHYGEIRHYLASNGSPIGPNDLLIAAQALAEDLTLVTDNLREFTRVPALRVENWV